MPAELIVFSNYTQAVLFAALQIEDVRNCVLTLFITFLKVALWKV